MFPTDLLQRLPKIGKQERAGTKCLQSIGSSPCFAPGMQRISVFVFLNAFSPFLYRDDYENTNYWKSSANFFFFVKKTYLLFSSKEIILIYFHKHSGMTFGAVNSLFLGIHFLKVHIKFFTCKN